VNPALAAWFPFEMFDNVRDVGLFAIDAGFFEGGIEKPAGRTNERFSRQVFFIAGLLADEEDVGAPGALAENGLRSRFPQVAGLAIGGCVFQ
jgi:hypothetical protein